DAHGAYARDLALTEHAGTHIDAPAHFHRGGATADLIPLATLVRPAVRLDVRELVGDDASFALSAEDIEDLEREDGLIRPDSAVLVDTGWDRYLDDPVRYSGGETTSFPGIGADAARLLVARRIVGGMAAVYRANDELLERDVAVKVLADVCADDVEIRQRFMREALAAARLSGQPHVVTIYDVGEHDGRPFIVMAYMAGGSMEERLRQGAQSPAQALTWLEQAAAALDTAHREGIVHRDVKPGNLLLDGADVVHV